MNWPASSDGQGTGLTPRELVSDWRNSGNSKETVGTSFDEHAGPGLVSLLTDDLLVTSRSYFWVSSSRLARSER